MQKKLMYILFDGSYPKVVTLEEAVEAYASSLDGVNNQEEFARTVLSNQEIVGDSSFEITDTELLLVVLVEDLVVTS
jgi:uncharacterized protein YjfI (DUF2170 family)